MNFTDHLSQVKTIYQTIEDKSNPKYTELNAPFLCIRSDAWLGKGYYFWDTFIENAHWWGEVWYKGNYIICSFKCDFNTKTCFDLVGSTEDMLDFSESVELLKQKRLIDERTTVARVLGLLKKTGNFNYDAVRVYGIGSRPIDNEKYRYIMHFSSSKPQFLDYKPAIQICIFEKTGLKLRNMRIEYPDKYVDESLQN